MKKKTTKTEEKIDRNPVIKGPRITEKAAIFSEKGVYTFNVATTATKNEIKKAISTMYKVTPVKVTITQIKSKQVVVRGTIGTKSGGKKAQVYLKKGDKITFA